MAAAPAKQRARGVGGMVGGRGGLLMHMVTGGAGDCEARLEEQRVLDHVEGAAAASAAARRLQGMRPPLSFSPSLRGSSSPRPSSQTSGRAWAALAQGRPRSARQTRCPSARAVTLLSWDGAGCVGGSCDSHAPPRPSSESRHRHGVNFPTPERGGRTPFPPRYHHATGPPAWL